MSAVSPNASILKRAYCPGTNCAKAVTCHEVARPETRLLASVVKESVALYSNHAAFTCFKPEIKQMESDEEISFPRQPRTAAEARRAYGRDYDPDRCLRAIDGGLGILWQCGHPKGKGSKGLFCGRHAIASH